MRRVLVGVSSLVLVAGCAGVSPSQLGQTAGTIVGAAIVPGIGAPVGALVGLLGGLLVQNEVDKATETHERKTLHEQLATAPSSAAAPEATPTGPLTRIWVDETMRDGRLTPGHFDSRYLP